MPVYNRRSSPSVNRFRSVREFILRWDASTERGASGSLRSVVGVGGKINHSGHADCFSSVILTAAHPQFADVIEEGVRPLVRLLVDHLGWITYSSCAGHRSVFADGEGVDFAPRHVGLIARDLGEGLRQRQWLLLAAAETNMHSPISVIVQEERLTCADGEDIGVIDIVFNTRDGDETAYFSELDAVTNCFCGHLIEVATRVCRDDSSKDVNKLGPGGDTFKL